MALKGKSVTVEVSTDDITYYNVDDMNSLAINAAGENLDITDFGLSYRARIQGLKDMSYSFSGFWNKDDTTGQIALRTAWKDDSTIYLKITADGTNGWKQIIKVGSITISTAVDGLTEVAFECTGNGDVTAVS